jgi:geranylgeranyl transferase type-2 subunit beta
VFVCVAALAILDRLDEVDQPTLCWWLSERQLPNGGLNGRPEKLEDVCYSFFVLSALSTLGKLSWIDSGKLEAFILSAQDTESGGIADRPGDMPDVFHTHFGLAGLSLLGYPALVDLDPVYCMPAGIIESLGLRKGWKALQRRTS